MSIKMQAILNTFFVILISLLSGICTFLLLTYVDITLIGILLVCGMIVMSISVIYRINLNKLEYEQKLEEITKKYN